MAAVNVVTQQLADPRDDGRVEELTVRLKMELLGNCTLNSTGVDLPNMVVHAYLGNITGLLDKLGRARSTWPPASSSGWHHVLLGPALYFLCTTAVLGLLLAVCWYVDGGGRRWTGRSSVSTMSRGTLRDQDLEPSDDGGFTSVKAAARLGGTRGKGQDGRDADWSARGSGRGLGQAADSYSLTQAQRLSHRLTDRVAGGSIRSVDALKEKIKRRRRPGKLETRSMTSALSDSSGSQDGQAADLRASMESQELLWSRRQTLLPDALYGRRQDAEGRYYDNEGRNSGHYDGKHTGVQGDRERNVEGRDVDTEGHLNTGSERRHFDADESGLYDGRRSVFNGRKHTPAVTQHYTFPVERSGERQLLFSPASTELIEEGWNGGEESQMQDRSEMWTGSRMQRLLEESKSREYYTLTYNDELGSSQRHGAQHKRPDTPMPNDELNAKFTFTVDANNRSQCQDRRPRNQVQRRLVEAGSQSSQTSHEWPNRRPGSQSSSEGSYTLPPVRAPREIWEMPAPQPYPGQQVTPYLSPRPRQRQVSRMSAALSSAYSTSQLELAGTGMYRHSAGQAYPDECSTDAYHDAFNNMYPDAYNEPYSDAIPADSLASTGDDSSDDTSISQSISRFRADKHGNVPDVPVSKYTLQRGSMTSSRSADVINDDASTCPRLGSALSLQTESLSGQGFDDAIQGADVSQNGDMSALAPSRSQGDQEKDNSGLDNSGFIPDPEEGLNNEAQEYRPIFRNQGSNSNRNSDMTTTNTPRNHGNLESGAGFLGDGDNRLPPVNVLRAGKVTTKERLREYGFIKMVGRKKYVVNPSPGKFFRRASSSTLGKVRKSSVIRRLQASPSPRKLRGEPDEAALLMSEPRGGARGGVRGPRVRGKPPRGPRDGHLSA